MLKRIINFLQRIDNASFVIPVVEPIPQPAPVVPTLGHKFLERIDVEKKIEKRATELRKRALADERVKNEIIVANFLEAVKVSLMHDILNMREPNSILIPDGEPFNTYRWRFEKALHTGKSDLQQAERYWETYERVLFSWGREQNLYIGICRRKDGRYEIVNWAARV